MSLANTNRSRYSVHMIVCICHRVSDRDIAIAARDGCSSFDELQFELAVATSCGKCHECARETFHRHVGQSGSSRQRSDCGGPLQRGKLIPTTAQHQPMAKAIG